MTSRLPPSGEAYRLSPQQQSLWSLRPEDAQALRARAGVRIEGNVDSGALRQALRRVVERHEILRTTFTRRAGMAAPLQVVSEAPEFSWREMAPAPSPESEADSWEALSRESDRTPFDLERGPLLRAWLLPRECSRSLLLLELPSLSGDAVTLKNLVAEVAQAQAGRLPEATGEDAPLQYADFAEWQRELLEAQDEAALSARAFWKRREAVSAAPARLPFEKKPDPRQAWSPSSIAISISPGLSEKVQAAARRFEADASDVLLAAWGALLGRTSGEPLLLLGVVGSGRHYEESERAMGLFAHWLPISFRVEEGETFGRLIARARDSAREAARWEEYYPGASTKALSEGHGLFGFERVAFPPPSLEPGASLQVIRLSCSVSPFRALLSAMMGGETLAAELRYDPRIFQREEMGRLARHFEALLESGVERPESGVGALALLGPEDRREMLSLGKGEASPFPEETIHRLFEAQAARSPNAVAVVSDDGALTYEALNDKANRLANLLRRAGVEAGTPVGLCLPPSAEAIAALLGILKAGGAYLPINPENPAPRILATLKASGSRLLVTRQDSLGDLDGFAGETIFLDGDAARLESEHSENLERLSGPEDLVAVISTSGSTGVPKGVGITHRSLVSYTWAIAARLAGGGEPISGMRFATVSTLAADLGNTCIFPSLLLGGRLHVLPFEIATDGAALAQQMSESAIDVLKIVPSHLAALLASGEGERLFPRKHLILGGEALTWELVERVRSSGARCELLNHYGPTEATVGCLTYSVGEGGRGSFAETVPVGRPLANTEAYVLDPYLEPVPRGVAGELFLGGMGVARGYVRQPRETAERFLPNPFREDRQERLYRTGDRARFLPDGNIEFLGRLDHQVKIRGYRVELGEIETALNEHPEVRQSLLVGRQDTSGEQRLVAYFVPGQGSPADSEGLRAFLRERLPEYMVPAAFVRMEAFPLTPNGKINRAALPPPAEETQAVFVAPRNSVEERIVAIWREVLGVQRVGVHDNFFDLGGHSLKATQVVSRLRAAFQVELPLRSLFESPTVAGLGSAIASQGAAAATSLAPIRSSTEKSAAALLANLDRMSDEEVGALLDDLSEREGVRE